MAPKPDSEVPPPPPAPVNVQEPPKSLDAALEEVAEKRAAMAEIEQRSQQLQFEGNQLAARLLVLDAWIDGNRKGGASREARRRSARAKTPGARTAAAKKAAARKRR
jgi:hypothetical protein